MSEEHDNPEEITDEEIAISNRGIIINDSPILDKTDPVVVEEAQDELITEEISDEKIHRITPTQLDERLARGEEGKDETEELPPERKEYTFYKPKHDLVFLPGTGGNFFATQIYDKLAPSLVGIFEYNERINEYSVKQTLSHLSINGTSRSNVVSEIRKIPQRLQYIHDYIYDMQLSRGINKYDWLLNELGNSLLVTHRLTQFDIQNIAFSDFLISKNSDNFTLEDEMRLMGDLRVGEFYDNLHDLFYHHYEAHLFPYMTDICHIPYHLNTFKHSKKPLKNYQYACIISNEQCLYTQLLQMVKHALRNKTINDSDVRQIREFVEKFTDSRHATYEHVMSKMYSEMNTIGINDIYSHHYYYREMILDVDEDRWGDFFHFFGFSEYFWLNKTRLIDNVHQYHSKNIDLLLNFVTKREIELLMYPITSNIRHR